MSHRGVQYVKQDQPAFLKKFKQRVGMKPEPTIADKIQTAAEDCVDEEKDDEKPVVVVLNDSDLTAEEAELHKNKETIDDGKIVFKKPAKRIKDSGLSATTKKPRMDSKPIGVKRDIGNAKSAKLKGKSREKTKPVSSSLLSFDENEEG